MPSQCDHCHDCFSVTAKLGYPESGIPQNFKRKREHILNFDPSSKAWERTFGIYPPDHGGTCITRSFLTFDVHLFSYRPNRKKNPSPRNYGNAGVSIHQPYAIREVLPQSWDQVQTWSFSVNYQKQKHDWEVKNWYYTLIHETVDREKYTPSFGKISNPYVFFFVRILGKYLYILGMYSTIGNFKIHQDYSFQVSLKFAIIKNLQV